MKYENFEKAKTIVEQIYRHTAMLAELNVDATINPGTGIIVTQRDSSYRICTISTDADSEHIFAALAREFRLQIIGDLQRRVNKLKTELEYL